MCVTCNFDADTRVCISKKLFKKTLTKTSLEENDQWKLELSDWKGLVLLLSVILTIPPYTTVITDDHPTVLIDRCVY
jgi:hypothetical protein